MPQVFISYSSEDIIAVDILTEIIQTLGQSPSHEQESVRVWNAARNIDYGRNWSNEIREGIRQSDVLVALLTPVSIQRPWIYFESGYKASSGIEVSRIDVVPLCIGVDLEQVEPLNTYQGTEIQSQEDLFGFIDRLFRGLGYHLNQVFINSVIEEKFDEIKLAINRSARELGINSLYNSNFEVLRYTFNTLTPIRDLDVSGSKFKGVSTSFNNFNDVAKALNKVKDLIEEVLPDTLYLYIVYRDDIKKCYKPVILPGRNESNLQDIEIPEEKSLIHYVYQNEPNFYFKDTSSDNRNHPKEGERSLYLTRLVHDEKAFALLGLSSSELDGISHEYMKFADEMATLVSSMFFSYINGSISNQICESFDNINKLRKEFFDYFHRQAELSKQFFS